MHKTYPIKFYAQNLGSHLIGLIKGTCPYSLNEDWHIYNPP